jgi:hypothetical protein
MQGAALVLARILELRTTNPAAAAANRWRSHQSLKSRSKANVLEHTQKFREIKACIQGSEGHEQENVSAAKHHLSLSRAKKSYSDIEKLTTNGLKTNDNVRELLPPHRASQSFVKVENQNSSTVDPSATSGIPNARKHELEKPFGEAMQHQHDSLFVGNKIEVSADNFTVSNVTNIEREESTATRRESSVPSGQIARIANFAGLGIGLALGTVGELARQAVAGTLSSSGGLKALVLNEKNSERLTLALCRMRGAALKLGQLLSIQDEHVIPRDSPLRAVIDRVREEAENMPSDQLYRVLRSELGSDWRSRLASFDDKPMAAASIGQVKGGGRWGEHWDGSSRQAVVSLDRPAAALTSVFRCVMSHQKRIRQPRPPPVVHHPLAPSRRLPSLHLLVSPPRCTAA